MKTLTRIYHPYNKWEEIEYNMWGNVKDRKAMERKVLKFMSDHKNFGYYMFQVVKKWKYSCEHNLTNISSNRIAYIGQSACALALKCPAEITKYCWNYLTDEQQLLANNEAIKVIEYWENNIYQYDKNKNR